MNYHAFFVPLTLNVIVKEGARIVQEDDQIFITNDPITGDPTMPTLTAEIENGDPAATANWKTRVWYFVDAAEKHRNDNERFPASGTIPLLGDSIWNITPLFGTGLRGGTTAVTVNTINPVKVGERTFVICGENPDDDVVIEYIRKVRPNIEPRWYAPAIAREESFVFKAPTHQFNQFNPPENTLPLEVRSKPNWARPDGWGIMQLDGKGLGRDITIEELWNWKKNVDEGLKVLESKEDDYVRYIGLVRQAYSGLPEWVDPSDVMHEVRNGGELLITITHKEAGIIKRYNGPTETVVFPESVSKLTFMAAWAFEMNAQGVREWVFHDEGRDYVRKVMEHHLTMGDN